MHRNYIKYFLQNSAFCDCYTFIVHVYRIDVETERNREFEGCSEGKADIYGDSVHEINGRLWRLWGVPCCSSY